MMFVIMPVLMATLDKPMGKLAKTLLGKFGRSATLKRVTSGPSYDTVTGSVSQSTSDVPCHVLLTDFRESQVDGTLVKKGDRKALVSRLALGVEPVPDADTLVEGGRTWKIVRVLGISSGEQEAAYLLHVRR